MKMQCVTSQRAGWTIEFQNCEDVVEGLHKICHGWRLASGSPLGSNRKQVRARIRCRGDSWQWQQLGYPKPRDWDRLPPKDTIRVLTDVQDAILHWQLDDDRRYIGLHAAAAKIGEVLACFPARGFSGKSTLMACLARRGHMVFGDDVIMVSAGGASAASFGFSPRLRTPFPADLAPPVLKFMRSCASPQGHGWAYLDLPESCQARLGQLAPIGSIVLMQRNSEGRTRLEPITRLAALKALLAEHLPGRQSMLQVFDCMKRMAQRADCYSLSFADADEAAAVLEKRLA